MLVYKCMMRMIRSRDRLCCLVTHVYIAYLYSIYRFHTTSLPKIPLFSI
jgi:hypothetical protein